MDPIGSELREVVRVLRQPQVTAGDGQTSGPGGPLPAPDHAPARCGCRGPLIWDSQYGLWRHLDDLSPCDPGRPRRPRSPRRRR